VHVTALGESGRGGSGFELFEKGSSLGELLFLLFEFVGVLLVLDPLLLGELQV